METAITYYMLGAGGEQLAVYKGVQAAHEDSSGHAGRRVYMYNESYISLGGTLVTLPDNTKQFCAMDNIGSVRLTVSVKGQDIATEHFDYKPFGDTLNAEGESRIGYAAQERDEESRYFAMGARQYDPLSGRFLSVDPLYESFPDKTPYHYCNNNPISFKDPSGLSPEGEKGKEDEVQAVVYPEEAYIVDNSINDYAEEARQEFKMWSSAVADKFFDDMRRLFPYDWGIGGGGGGGGGGGINGLASYVTSPDGALRVVFGFGTQYRYGDVFGVNATGEFSEEKIAKYLYDNPRCGFSLTLEGVSKCIDYIFNSILDNFRAMYSTGEGFEIISGLRKTGVHFNLLYSSSELTEMWNGYYCADFKSILGVESSDKIVGEKYFWWDYKNQEEEDRKSKGKGYYNICDYVHKDPFSGNQVYLAFDNFFDTKLDPLYVLSHELRHKWDNLYYRPFSMTYNPEERAYFTAEYIYNKLKKR